MKKTLIQTLIMGAVFYCVRYINLWWMLGSSHLYFSGTSLLGPLAGIYVPCCSLSFVFSLSLVRAVIFQTISAPLKLLQIYHIPTQLSALYWTMITLSPRLRVLCAGLPLLCMVLFMLHPVGVGAGLYTIYWLIPIISLLVPHHNRWVHALSSTFMAHAAGSVLWIWTHPAMTATMWLGLIPLVACERVIIATGVWAVSHGVEGLWARIQASARMFCEGLV